MCGIAGTVGGREALPVLLETLHRESYRGYDSSGVVVFGEAPMLVKAVGHLDALEKKLARAPVRGTIGLGHNRWATHGGVTEANAHPHTDCSRRIFIVHNGIIENEAALRADLRARGHMFSSETDTEVIAHLTERFFRGNLAEAVRRALRHVRGTYGLAAICWDDPGKIVAARRSSPLALAVGDTDGSVASDPAAFATRTKKVVHLDDDDLAVIEPGRFRVTDLRNTPRRKRAVALEGNREAVQKGAFPHFTLKEIHEQPEALARTLHGRLFEGKRSVQLRELHPVSERLAAITRVHVIACGTAAYAGMVAQYLFEEHAGLPTVVDIASEFRYRAPIVEPRTAYLCISQSGETADTLWSLREVKRRGGLTIGIVNVAGSSIARETDACIVNHAGPEISVMSTKAFTSQLAILALLTVFLGRQRGMTAAAARAITQHLARVPEHIRKTLRVTETMAALAAKHRAARHMLLIGRKYNYPIALEGAMKLKEAAYVHGQGYGAGELKHGSLALVDEETPVIALCPSDSVYDKVISNVQEVKARRGTVLAIASDGNADLARIADDVVVVPRTLEMLTPILTVVPLQLFAYASGVLRGVDVDTPRNLAKSVTVE